MRAARCNRCGHPIIWCLTTKRDGSMGKLPFDQDTHPRGTHLLVLGSDPVARFVPPEDRRITAGAPATLHLEHFRSCSANNKTT